MLLAVSSRLRRWASFRSAVAAAGGLVVFVAASFPIVYRAYPEAANLASLDAPVIFTAAEVYEILAAWGPRGRSLQLWFHLIWDTVVPTLAFLTAGLWISWLLGHGLAADSRWQRLNLVALGAGFDILENLCIVIVAASYPRRLPALAWLKTGFTTAKYASGLLILLVLLVGIGAAVSALVGGTRSGD